MALEDGTWAEDGFGLVGTYGRRMRVQKGENQQKKTDEKNGMYTQNGKN